MFFPQPPHCLFPRILRPWLKCHIVSEATRATLFNTVPAPSLSLLRFPAQRRPPCDKLFAVCLPTLDYELLDSVLPSDIFSAPRTVPGMHRAPRLCAGEGTNECPLQTASLAGDSGMCLGLLPTAGLLRTELPAGLRVFKLASANKLFLQSREKAASLQSTSRRLSTLILSCDALTSYMRLPQSQAK